MSRSTDCQSFSQRLISLRLNRGKLKLLFTLNSLS